MTAARILAVIGAAYAFLGVAAGAFGAHALRARVSADLLAVFETAVRYQMYHALAILIVAVALGRWAGPQAVWAGWLFVGGIAVFSGTLYLLVLTGARWWGAITPVGGVTLLAGWACFAWSIVTGPR